LPTAIEVLRRGFVPAQTLDFDIELLEIEPHRTPPRLASPAAPATCRWLACRTGSLIQLGRALSGPTCRRHNIIKYLYSYNDI
jgi:hypothetical protein